MISANPFKEFYNACETTLHNALTQLYPQISIYIIPLKYPSNSKFGELTSTICFKLSKQTSEKPLEIAKKITKAINITLTN